MNTYTLIAHIVVLFLCTQTISPLALDWKKTAQKDFGEIERKLKKYHPGMLDPKSTHFKYWLVQGKKEFQQRLPQIDSEMGVALGAQSLR